jgi:hypothetical protein
MLDSKKNSQNHLTNGSNQPALTNWKPHMNFKFQMKGATMHV